MRATLVWISVFTLTAFPRRWISPLSPGVTSFIVFYETVNLMVKRSKWWRGREADEETAAGGKREGEGQGRRTEEVWWICRPWILIDRGALLLWFLHFIMRWAYVSVCSTEVDARRTGQQPAAAVHRLGHLSRGAHYLLGRIHADSGTPGCR